MSAALLREMFAEMVVRKDPSLIPRYYHEDFLLTTNGQEQDYAEFARGHQHVYRTDISYRVDYDESSWTESGDQVAVRMWITTRRGGQPTKIEIVLIARFRDGRIDRLWELTWPDWSALDTFQDYG